MALASDAEGYYRQGFDPADPQVAYLTGSSLHFSREQVISFFLRCTEDPDRYDFLILDPTGTIIGESVLNEIDWDRGCANYRIAIFKPEYFGKGIGTWATQCIRDFAFEELRLRRIELDVFSFNPRAERVYTKAGFHREEIRKDAIRDGDGYADEILMAIEEAQWRKLKN